MEITYLVIGVVLGIVIGWLLAKTLNKTVDNSSHPNKALDDLRMEKTRLEERSANLQDELNRTLKDLETERDSGVEKDKRLAKAEEAFKNMQEKFNSQEQELAQLQEKFQKEFEVIASRILRSNTEQISKINNEKLADTLKPLGERIKSFEDKIEKSGKEREGLKEQIKLLHDLNQKMAEEASNLTKALKGDTKKQGNWGEIVLEKVLERSGLVKGDEYKMEVATENQDGNRIRPDAVVFLPENKHIIIDSKVSLVAYDQVVNEDTDESRDAALKQHLLSVRSHIKTLSSKEYQSSSEFNSPDFVLLFMPIESAFSVALQADNTLFADAWDEKIVIVSPTTLLATLRTIASIWTQERQNRNAIKIAEEGGKLYDKFVGFLNDLEGIGRHIDQTQRAYDEAYNKLKSGRGNLIGKAEQLKTLGAKATKSIDTSVVEESGTTTQDEAS